MPRRVNLDRFMRWETLLALILLVIVLFNISQSPVFLTVNNLINLFVLHIEQIIVVLPMALIIINAEIDLSVASVMGLSACLVANLFAHGMSMELAIVVGLLAGVVCGAFNGFWVAYAGLPSLAVTLAGLIGYRGVAEVLVGDRSISNFPDWFNRLGQQPLVGPLPLSLIIFFVLVLVFVAVLHFSGFGRYIYAVGNNREAARYSGVRVRQVKMILLVLSGLIASLAGILYMARLGAARASTAQGFELPIITIVLLGGVSIFGGKGNLLGVILSVMVVLCIDNGMNLLNITGNTQSIVIGILLILSVIIPNFASDAQNLWNRHRFDAQRE